MTETTWFEESRRIENFEPIDIVTRMRTIVWTSPDVAEEYPGCTTSVDTLTKVGADAGRSAPHVEGTLRVWNGNVREAVYAPGEWVAVRTWVDV